MEYTEKDMNILIAEDEKPLQKILSLYLTKADFTVLTADDGDIWAEQKEAIVNHVLPWSTFARQAIQREMTDFTCLSEDRLVQQTTYGTDITVTANFTHREYTGNGITVPADSVLIQTPEGNSVYSPK